MGKHHTLAASASGARLCKLKLKQLSRKKESEKATDLPLLQRYFDRQRELESVGQRLSDVDPALYQAGMSLEIKYMEQYALREQLTQTYLSTLKAGLIAIGSMYGAQMASTPNAPAALDKRFKQFWNKACSDRKLRLDGRTAYFRDIQGPMFCSFAKAAGWRPIDLDRALDTIERARRGQCQLALSDAERWGLV